MVNFDEVQDFEGQICIFVFGCGLMDNVDFNVGICLQLFGDFKVGFSLDFDVFVVYVGLLMSFVVSFYCNQDGLFMVQGVVG